VTDTVQPSSLTDIATGVLNQLCPAAAMALVLQGDPEAILQHVIEAVLAEAGQKAEARVAELKQAMTEIRHIHKDSPMGPCPVCVDADAMARGDDGTVPYPCPTARLAGAKDCDPPSFRESADA
jgi:hypothetical protein